MRTPGGSDLSDPTDDADADFRDAVRGTRPLQHSPRVTWQRKPAPRARFTRQDRYEVLAESMTVSAAELDVEVGDELRFRREGVQDAVLRKLRRGVYRVDAEIDLHGLTEKEAREALRDFLARAVAQQLRCVRIVTGKGLRSGPRGPVLKVAVNAILRKTGPVVAFCSARQIDGGTGAVYVLLSSWPAASPTSTPR